MVLGIISFAATQLHVGLAFIGLMLCFSSIMAFIRTAKKIRYRKNYKLVLRKCVKKQIHESDDGNSYYLFFLSFMDTLNYLSAEVSKKEYDATEIGDLFYIAASKKHKNDDYDVAAYFSESKWRLE